MYLEMRKSLFYWFPCLVIALCVGFFSSCGGDDDSGGGTPPAASSLVGTVWEGVYADGTARIAVSVESQAEVLVEIFDAEDGSRLDSSRHGYTYNEITGRLECGYYGSTVTGYIKGNVMEYTVGGETVILHKKADSGDMEDNVYDSVVVQVFPPIEMLVGAVWEGAHPDGTVRFVATVENVSEVCVELFDNSGNLLEGGRHAYRYDRSTGILECDYSGSVIICQIKGDSLICAIDGVTIEMCYRGHRPHAGQ